MPVIISDSSNPSYNGRLSTTNGFYRCEASNLGTFGNQLSLSSSRQISVTFANAGNCKGVVLVLSTTTNTTSSLKSVTVDLQEFVASTWTTRATKTLTANEIANSVTNPRGIGWIIPFVFPSAYAVTTAASTWRFNISNATGSNDWSLNTSDGTNISYAAWCDNAVTATNNDQLIAKDLVIINQSFTLRGVLGTGDSTRSVCGWMCRQTTPTAGNAFVITWENPALASYTLTINGLLLTGAHSGMRVGTQANPITRANKAIIDIVNASSGTSTISGISGPNYTAGGELGSRQSLFFYGEVPPVQKCKLAANANVGASSITTDIPTGWVNGDRIFIGRQNVRGTGELTVYTVTSSSGTTVNISPNIATNQRLSGGSVIRLNDYGIVIKGFVNASIVMQAPSCCNFVGVQFQNVGFSGWGNTSHNNDDAANQAQWVFQNCSVEWTSTTANFLSLINPPLYGILIDNVQLMKGYISSSFITSPGLSGRVTISNCVELSMNTFSANGVPASSLWTVENCIFENATNPFIILNGIPGCRHLNNFYWASSASGVNGAINLTSMFGVIENEGNQYENNNLAIGITGNIINSLSNNDIFGAITANATDVLFQPSILVNYVMSSPTGAVNVSTTNQSLMVDNTRFCISEYNNTTNDDRNWLKNGFIVRTGFGLSDTLVWNGTAFAAASSGQFGLRLQPNSGTNILSYQDNAGVTNIGNCQNLLVTVSVRLKINNAAYYAGTHVLPRLKVTYDNGTVVTAQATATTAAQQLLVNFTPTTTNNFITIELETATDATTTNAYVYFGELLVSQPSGVLIDTTRFGGWKAGLPLGTFRTFPTPASVWDEMVANRQINGSFGKAISSIPSDVLGQLIESGISLQQAIRIALAVLAGKSSGGNTNTITFRDINDTKNRVIADVTNDGNRTNVTLDAS